MRCIPLAPSPQQKGILGFGARRGRVKKCSNEAKNESWANKIFSLFFRVIESRRLIFCEATAAEMRFKI